MTGGLKAFGNYRTPPTDEEKRHFLNVGWVSVEFATVEADIGEMLWLLLEGSYPVDTDYMVYVKDADALENGLKECGARYPEAKEVFTNLRDAYRAVKANRDKLARSSIGVTVLSTTGDVDRILRLRHARSGDVRNIPTDEEIQSVIREITDLSDYVEAVRWSKIIVAIIERIRPALEKFTAWAATLNPTPALDDQATGTADAPDKPGDTG